jgi:hypothetical protein
VISDIQPGRHGLLRSSIRIRCPRIYANAVERRIVLYFIGLSVFFWRHSVIVLCDFFVFDVYANELAVA